MDQKIKDSSYDVRPFTAQERTKWKKNSKSILEWLRVGPQGYVMPDHWLEHAEEIRKMPLRPSDIWVVTFPRSGTTWTQELVWLINNNLDFDAAKATPLTQRYAFLESFSILNPIAKVMLKESTDEKIRNMITNAMIPAHEILARTTSSRFIKTHHPVSLLPEGVLDTSKVVYVARDPRDVLVSCYHFFSMSNLLYLTCDFKEYFELFINDMTIWSQYFEHVKEAWNKRHHPNMLFLFYEELLNDLKGSVKRVADFFGKTYSDEQYDQLCDHLTFKNFQNNKSVSDISEMVEMGFMVTDDVSNQFVRKGKSGGWRDYFDEEMSARAQAWILRNLQDTDFRFPHMEL